jgi:hypothetical protein
MKRLFAIFSFLLLVLSLVPCPDEVLVSPDFDEGVVASATDFPIESGEEEECPPFCCCACCKVPLIRLADSVDEAERRNQSPQILPGVMPIKGVINEIWQPPQV